MLGDIVGWVIQVTEERLHELFKLWQTRLGLDLWHIEVRIENPKSPTSMMDVRKSTAYSRAIVRVPQWILDGGPIPDGILDVTIDDKFIEQCIIHELLHCQRRETGALVFDRLEGLLHRDVYSVVTGSFDAAEELEIENLAASLAEAFGSFK